MESTSAVKLLAEQGVEQILEENDPDYIFYTSLQTFAERKGRYLTILFKEGEQIGYCLLADNNKHIIKQDQTVKFDPAELKISGQGTEVISIDLNSLRSTPP